VVRELILASQIEGLARVAVTVADEVATYLNNKNRRELSKLEDESGITVQVFGSESAAPEHLVIERHDANGREIKFPVG
jgi:ribonuclease E